MAATLYPAPEHQTFTMGDNPAKVLLIHGFPGTPWEVRHIGRVLAGNGWEAFGPLLPGFGPSIETLGQRHAGEWLEFISDRLRLLRNGSGEGPLAVVGFSMGGGLATILAAQEEIDALVLINPFSGLPLPVRSALPLVTRALRYYRPFWRANFDDPWTRQVIGRVLPDLDVDDLNDQELLRREVKIPLSAIEQVQSVGGLAWDAAPHVHAPTLIVQGTRDTVVPALRTRRFSKRFAGPLRYVEVPGRHPLVWPHQSGYREMIDEVTGFLDPTNLAASKPATPFGQRKTASATRPPHGPELRH